MQQSGMSSKSDVLSQIQERRLDIVLSCFLFLSYTIILDENTNLCYFYLF